jgi:hypothetical protein
LVQDGAPYHRAAVVKAFFEQHRDRLHVTQLPSYSPDYNPIEYLWRATKRTATHNRYFPAFQELIASVEEALAALSRQPERVKALFGLYLDDLLMTARGCKGRGASGTPEAWQPENAPHAMR